MIWRWCCSQSRCINGKIEVDLKLVKKELDIAPWIDALHLWILPDWATHVGAMVTIVGTVLLFVLVPGPSESTPMVENYSVRYITSGETIHLTLVEAAQQGIEIHPGDSVRVEANMVDGVEVHCKWHAILRDRLNPEQGSAAWYRAQLGDTDDVIVILIESKCRTRERWTTIPVTIRHP
jgi:hypothetical protein